MAATKWQQRTEKDTTQEKVKNKTKENKQTNKQKKSKGSKKSFSDADSACSDDEYFAFLALTLTQPPDVGRTGSCAPHAKDWTQRQCQY